MDYLKNTFGEYPPEYNRAVHGPYNPAVYYGKRDTNFGDVKLKDLPAWFRRRSYNPVKWIGACSRAYWRYMHNFVWPKYGGQMYLNHVILFVATVGFVTNYQKNWNEATVKYH